MYAPVLAIWMDPTFGMDTACPSVNGPETPVIVKLVTVRADPPDPESLVNTFPVTGVSSIPDAASSTIEGMLFIAILATAEVTFPQT